MIRSLFLLIFTITAFVAPSYAACTSPSGGAGDVLFNADYHVLQFCDGTTWQSMSNAVPFAANSGCTGPTGAAGDLLYTSAQRVMQFCNGEEWIGIGDSSATACTEGSGCTGPAGSEGDMIYSATYGVMEFCNGSSWVSMKGGGGRACGMPSCPSTGLVGYWRFDEGSGTTAYDSSDTADNGTLNSGPVWAAGKFGGALTFDGINDSVNIPDNTLLRGNQDLTLSTWIKPDSSAAQQTIISKDWNGNFKDWDINVDPTGDFRWISEVSGSSYRLFSSNAPITFGQWSHVAAVLDKTNSRLTLYVNGVQVAQDAAFNASTQSDNSHASNISIGRRYYASGGAGSAYYSGKIDDVRFYNRALSAAEISQLYNGGTGCP